MNRTQRRSPLALIAFLMIALLLVPATGWASEAARTTLSGVVTADDGRPLQGAQVEIFHYGGGLVGSLTTGADGQFAASLPPSAERLYWVRAWAKEFDTAEQVWVVGQASIRLTLVPLYGSVTGWIDGPEGSPAGGARVELVRDGSPALVATATHNGRFWFNRVPAGDGYTLRVSATGLVPSITPVGRVTAGRETGLTASLRTFQGQVAGAVADKESGAPLVGATLSIEQVGLGVVATTVAGTGGSFTASVPAVAGATYRVHARLTDYQPALSEPFQLDAKGWARLDGERRLNLARLSTDLTARLLDSDGDPLPGAPLWLEREGVGIVAEGTTGEDGTFRFAGIPAGDLRYRVRAVPPTMRKDQTDHKWSVAASEWLTPTPGRWMNLSLSLVAGDTHDYGDGEIMGRVTLLGESPVAGATVELIRAGKGVVATTETAADGTYRFTAVEANLPSAQAAVRGRPGTGYVVRVSRNDHYPAASELIDVSPEKQSLVDLTIAHVQGTAVVHVVDQNGLPVEGATIRLLPARGGQPVVSVTAAAGIGRVRAPLFGAYWLEVEREGYHKAQFSPLALAAGKETVVDLTVGAQSATLYGQVTDNQGRPVTGPFRVTALAADGREVSDAVRPDGSYSLTNLAPGAPALVSLRDGDSVLATFGQAVTAAPGERLRVDLTLTQPTGSVRGRVVDESGRPASGAVVELRRSGDGSIATTRTDAEGYYRFERVQTGLQQRYAVRLNMDGQGYRQLGNRMPPPLFLLGAGETKHVDLVLTALPTE